jgi:hypothetical protein
MTPSQPRGSIGYASIPKSSPGQERECLNLFPATQSVLKATYQQDSNSIWTVSQVRKADPVHLSFIISDFSFSHFLKPAHERRVVVLRRSACDAINGQMKNEKCSGSAFLTLEVIEIELAPDHLLRSCFTTANTIWNSGASVRIAGQRQCGVSLK